MLCFSTVKSLLGVVGGCVSYSVEVRGVVFLVLCRGERDCVFYGIEVRVVFLTV